MTYKKCEICLRNADTFKNKCAYCSKLDFLYSQGVITTKNYLKEMLNWLGEKRFKELNFDSSGLK